MFINGATLEIEEIYNKICILLVNFELEYMPNLKIVKCEFNQQEYYHIECKINNIESKIYEFKNNPQFLYEDMRVIDENLSNVCKYHGIFFKKKKVLVTKNLFSCGRCVLFFVKTVTQKKPKHFVFCICKLELLFELIY